MGGGGHTSGSSLTTLSELTQGMRCFPARYTSSGAVCTTRQQTSSQETCGSEANRSPRWISEGELLVSERGTSICEKHVQLISSRTSSQRIIASEHAITRSPFMYLVSMMDRADAWVCLQQGENNAGFIFSEVSVISVSTKQMSLTLERSKSRFTTSACRVTTPRNKHQTDW